jgi:hypothetical protein
MEPHGHACCANGSKKKGKESLASFLMVLLPVNEVVVALVGSLSPKRCFSRLFTAAVKSVTRDHCFFFSYPLCVTVVNKV